MNCPNCGSSMFLIQKSHEWHVAFGFPKLTYGGSVPRTEVRCQSCQARPQGEHLTKLLHIAAQLTPQEELSLKCITCGRPNPETVAARMGSVERDGELTYIPTGEPLCTECQSHLVPDIAQA